MKKVRSIIICVILTLVVLTCTYVDKRINHSFGERYASPPPELDMRWVQINYDTHFIINRPLYYLHIPLKWLDHKITGVDIRIWMNDFEGDKSNYSREYYN